MELSSADAEFNTGVDWLHVLLLMAYLVHEMPFGKHPPSMQDAALNLIV